MKKNNIGKIITVVLCIAAVIVFAMVKSGMTPQFIINYQNNFKRNILGICNKMNIELPIEMQLYLDEEIKASEPVETMMPAAEKKEMEAHPGYDEENKGKVTLTVKEKSNENEDLPIEFKYAENSSFAYYDDKMICANDTCYAHFDKDGNCSWSKNIQMKEPMLTVSGKYILINERGGKKVSLYKGKRLLFTEKTEGNILTADLSENGDVILVTEKELYKGQVVVFNKKGTKIYAWDSGSYSILDAAVSKNRRAVVSLLDTDTGVGTILAGYDIRNGKKVFETSSFEDVMIFDVSFCGNNISALADNKLMRISPSGKLQKEYDFEGASLKKYAKSESGFYALLFDTDGRGEIRVLRPNCKPAGSFVTQNMPDTINIKGRLVAYNNGRQAVLSNYNGNSRLVADCSADVKQLHITGSKKLFGVYTASIQNLEVQKKKETKEVFEEENKEGQ